MSDQPEVVDVHATCTERAASLQRSVDYYSSQVNERTRDWNRQRNAVKDALISAHEESMDAEDLIREVARLLNLELTVEKEFSFTITGTMTVTIDLLESESMPETWDLEQSFNVSHDEDNVDVQSWDVDVNETY